MPQDIEKLIANHKRRLQKLKEQKASRGLATPAEVLIEIEDINETIEVLRTELARITLDSEFDDVLLQRFLEYQAKLKNVLWEQLIEDSYKFRDIDDVNKGIRLIVKTLQEQSFVPDIIAHIYDPDAPGGRDVGYLLHQHFENAKTMEIKIRTIDYVRGVIAIENQDSLPQNKPVKLLVVDDVAISGHTIGLAIQELKKMNPELETRVCVLFASEDLVEKRDDIVYARTTNTSRVIFPWGWVKATDDFERKFRGFTVLNKYNISWLRRPWGTEEIFSQDDICSVKILTIEGKEELSLQRHWYRDEIWYALEDGVGVQIEDKKAIVQKGAVILVPRGMWHRLYAGRNHKVQVLEVAFGQYDQVNDIERLEDKYGRVGEDGSV